MGCSPSGGRSSANTGYIYEGSKLGRKGFGARYESIAFSDPYLNRLIADYLRHLPSTTADFPDLTAQDVEEFRALGRRAEREREAGNHDAAAAAIEEQLGISPGSPDPYAELARVYLDRGDVSGASERLREAVVRGFTDLDRLSTSPEFADLRYTHDFRVMERTAPYLRNLEGNWNRWSRFEAATAPTGVREVELEYAYYRKQLEQIAPVLGPKLTRSWEQWLDFAAAALLEQYVAQNRYAEDLQAAIVWLFQLYSDGEQFQWTTISRESAVRLEKISRVVLERFPEQDLRADAWVASALATFSRARTKRGSLKLGRRAAREIERDLGFVLTQHPDSPRRFDATVGLILVAIGSGDLERARELYGDLLNRYGEDEALLARARNDLGGWTLRLGGLPEFQVATLDGRSIDPVSLQGKVVLLDFWATWCGPCVAEFEGLRKIIDRYEDDGLLVIGWSMDHADDLPAAGLEEWLAEHDVAWPQVYQGNAWESELAEQLVVEEIPYTVLIAADGTVLGTDLHGRELEKAVDAAVRETLEGRR